MILRGKVYNENKVRPEDSPAAHALRGWMDAGDTWPGDCSSESDG